MTLIILDRDGVINEDRDDHIRTTDQWRPIPGSLDGIAKLYDHGHTVVVATNQSGIARGYFNETTLDAIHTKMKLLIESHGGKLAGIYYCPHHLNDECACRKPKPGLIDQIVQDFPKHDLNNSYLIGDSWRDIQAGKARNLKTILVQTGKGPIALSRHQHELGDTRLADNLETAVDLILEELA